MRHASVFCAQVRQAQRRRDFERGADANRRGLQARGACALLRETPSGESPFFFFLALLSSSLLPFLLFYYPIKRFFLFIALIAFWNVIN